MNRARTIFCIIACLQLCTGIATADDPFIPATVTFNAPGGHFNNWIKDIPCSSGRFVTLLTISDVAPTDKWEGVGQIILRNGTADGAGADAAAFNLQTNQTRSPLIARARQWKLGQTTSEAEFHFPGLYQLGQPVTVLLEWTDAQDLSFTIDDKARASMHLKNPVRQIELVGSGATVLFDKNSLVCNPPPALPTTPDAANGPSTVAKPDGAPQQ